MGFALTSAKASDHILPLSPIVAPRGRSQVSPFRSETPPRRFGPSGDHARRFAKKSAQEEESKRKSPVNLSDNVSKRTLCDMES